MELSTIKPIIKPIIKEKDNENVLLSYKKKSNEEEIVFRVVLGNVYDNSTTTNDDDIFIYSMEEFRSIVVDRVNNSKKIVSKINIYFTCSYGFQYLIYNNWLPIIKSLNIKTTVFMSNSTLTQLPYTTYNILNYSLTSGCVKAYINKDILSENENYFSPIPIPQIDNILKKCNETEKHSSIPIEIHFSHINGQTRNFNHLEHMKIKELNDNGIKMWVIFSNSETKVPVYLIFEDENIVIHALSVNFCDLTDLSRTKANFMNTDNFMTTLKKYK